MTNIDPTVRRQELGAELRVLRKKAHFTLEQACEIINVSPSKLSRIETGHRRASPEEVSALLAVYGADHKKRDRLLALTRECDEVGWWQRNLTDYAERKHTLITLESKAESIVSFELGLVPSLLQTGEYTRAVMLEMGVIPEEDIEERMVTRLRRHSVLLRREPPELLAIIDELALRRIVGGRDVLRCQLEHLIQEADRPNITIRVVPNDGQVHSAVDGSFIVVRRSGFSPVVFIETLTSGLFVEERAEVDMYELVLRNLLNRALSQEESIALIARLASRLDTEASNGWPQPTYPR
jgi:transcriptional regulator with XRE-family HTH domain